MKPNNEIIIKHELRPCIVNGLKSLFHGWEQRSEVIPPSPLKGGHSGGEIKLTLGIIEREDGTIHKAYPEEIRFIDMAVNHYFGENATALDFEKQEQAEKQTEQAEKETRGNLFTRRNKIY